MIFYWFHTANDCLICVILSINLHSKAKASLIIEIKFTSKPIWPNNSILLLFGGVLNMLDRRKLNLCLKLKV